MDSKGKTVKNKAEKKSKFSFDSQSTSNFYSCESNMTFADVDKNEFQCRTYKNAGEYARALQPWLAQYRMWMMMNNTMPALLSMQFMNNIPQTTQFTPQNNASVPNVNSPTVNRNVNVTQPAPAAGGVRTGLTGTEFEIPPLWKRVCAELIDFVILFYLKMIVAVIIMRQLGLLPSSRLLDVHMDLTPISILELTEGDVDIDKIFSVTSEVIAIEIVNRIFITIFEALCIRQGFRGTIGGATPGKRFMKLKVVSCDQVVDMQNGKVLVIPAQNTGFLCALVRSVIKNFTMAFLFPACFTVFFFHHSRAAYDVIGRTIVVQVPSNLRRRAH